MMKLFRWLQTRLNKITGIETPLFGVSWDPTKLESEIFASLLTHLEDRRTLFAMYEDENQKSVEDSINHIRQLLTEHLAEISDRNSVLARHLREMRQFSREFVEYSEYLASITDGGYSLPPEFGGGWTARMYLLYSQGFFAALGIFRARFLKHIRFLIEHFDIETNDEIKRLIAYDVREKSLAITGWVSVFTHRNSVKQTSYSLEPTILLSQPYPDGSKGQKIWLLEPSEDKLWRKLYDRNRNESKTTVIGWPSHDYEKLIVEKVIESDPGEANEQVPENVKELRNETNIYLSKLFESRRPPNRA